mmetsp:Transcript_5989/g.18446  ORF Transcript_5989/g.18446 Transcript_5989/m.18446 type:complete len:217 (-) Transcript_5989:173-823(-)
MVEAVTACVEDARRVVHKGIGADADRDGLLRGRLEQRLLVALGHLLVTVDVDGRAVGLLAAVASPEGAAPGGPVCIVVLGVDAAVGDDVLVRVVHEASHAALVLFSVAVDELLLAERHELARLDGVDALHGASRRKRPARAARALVLDAGDGALREPVDRTLDLDVGVHEAAQARGAAGAAQQVRPQPQARLSKLILRQVGKLRQRHLRAAACGAA